VCSDRADKRREVSCIFADGHLMINNYLLLSITVFKKIMLVILLLIIQFYTKLEEKHKALEAEKDQAEARKKVKMTYVLCLVDNKL
jgi:hypothetical protein